MSPESTLRNRQLLQCILVAGMIVLAGFLKQTPVSAAGKVLYVNAKASGATNGTSWANAYINLQSALADAQSGDEIWVAEGVYVPGSMPEATFQLKNGVAMYGGFAGNETARDQRNWRQHVTVLSGDIDHNDQTDEHGIVTNGTHIVDINSYHVVTGSDTDDTALLDGFTITAGNSKITLPTPCDSTCGGGGGMVNFMGSPTLSNIIFQGNRAYDGGGIFNLDSSPRLTHISFLANGDYIGGGMYNNESNPILIDVTFQANQAEFGGGMFNIYSNPVLADVTFQANQTLYQGGAIYSQVSNLILTNVTFLENQTTNGGGSSQGAGMFNDRSSSTLTNVIFQGNRATPDNPDSQGGAIYSEFDESILTLTNVTFSGNQASHGGGVFADYHSHLVVQNSIVWGNKPDDITVNDANYTASHSLISDRGDPNPLFVNTSNGDLRLQAGSPAINAGENKADLDASGPGTKTIADVATDLAGKPRIINDIVDLGAYEFQGEPSASNPPPPSSSPLRLSVFTTETVQSGVRLHWETEAELHNAGFNIYRLADNDGVAIKVNSVPIPALGNSDAGAVYDFVDWPGSGHFLYIIKNVDEQGNEYLNGQVEAVTEGAMLFVPSLSAP